MTQPSNQNPSALAPRVIAWESTRACNYACQHCRAQAQRHADPNQLTTKEAHTMIDQITEFCKPILIISGGDPLQRADIFEVAKYASDCGLRVVMSPSGSNITPEVIEKLKGSGVKMISLSLDGSNAEIHDGFRQVTGAFDLAIHNMVLAREMGIPFRINTTVTQHNLSDLQGILKLATVVGAAEWDVFMLVPTGRGKIEMEITPAQYEETLQSVYQWSLKSAIPVKVTCAPQYSRITAQNIQRLSEKLGKHGAGSMGCMVGDGFCFISHVGEVYGCGFLPVPAGNIRQQNFKEIYQNSLLFNKLRNHSLLKGKCGDCSYKTACGGCRARAYATHKDYLEEEPYCSHQPSRNKRTIGS